MHALGRLVLGLVLALASCRCEGAPPEPARGRATAPAGSTAATATSSPEGSCPPDMAPLGGGGCIDRYEASAGTGELGDAEGKGTTVVAVSAARRPPLSAVSWHQAAKACANTGKELCGDRAWIAACQGAGGWEYPYGNSFEPGRCNDWRTSHEGRDGPLPTGSMSRCVTPAGVFDLSGNLGEWTYPVKAEREDASVRGGSYNHTIVDSSCRHGYGRPRTAQDASAGFRCCLRAGTAPRAGASAGGGSVPEPPP
ncbi:MAG: SUMF1/EgtB/PvdO family nonheme iron enzyme [Deltaproteobacteria bacterium]|nr:SUMF1/EgtB/PvdO family nonheme iron enzyme [Deltaproteobacteria bacterium]